MHERYHVGDDNERETMVETELCPPVTCDKRYQGDSNLSILHTGSTEEFLPEAQLVYVAQFVIRHYHGQITIYLNGLLIK
jgi:hypothetical protein